MTSFRADRVKLIYSGLGREQSNRSPGSLRGLVAAEARSMVEAGIAARLLVLARRCREASQWTTVPDLTRELDDIADRLVREAERIDGK